MRKEKTLRKSPARVISYGALSWRETKIQFFLAECSLKRLKLPNKKLSCLLLLFCNSTSRASSVNKQAHSKRNPGFLSSSSLPNATKPGRPLILAKHSHHGDKNTSWHQSLCCTNQIFLSRVREMKNYCSLPPQEAGVCVFSCAVAGSVASFPLEDCYELWPDPVTAEVNGSFAIDFNGAWISLQIFYPCCFYTQRKLFTCQEASSSSIPPMQISPSKVRIPKSQERKS